MRIKYHNVKSTSQGDSTFSRHGFFQLNAITDAKSCKVNLGQIQAEMNGKKEGIKALSDVEFQVFSQFGDDGIIQWLTRILPLPYKTFIEFGVGNYRESNTRFLLLSNYWSGLVIDSSDKNVREIRRNPIYSFYDLKAIRAWITKDNIDQHIASAEFPADIGILSIDLDGNDYWVWEAISSVRPIIVIIEYNSLFGFEQPLTVSYRENSVRGQNRPFNFWGASLAALVRLARTKGYCFIGCNSAGNNAYFVRTDFISYCPLGEVTAESGYVFANFTEAWDTEGNAKRGKDNIMSLDKLEVYDIEKKDLVRLDSYSIYLSLRDAGKLRQI